MAPIPKKALAALNAMKAIGFKVQTAKPVLKNLLKVYDNNWVHIEAENYRVLADAILDMQESQAEEQKQKKKMVDDDVDNKGKNVIENDKPEPLRTRLRVRGEDHDLQSSKISVDSVCETSLKRQKLEADALPESNLVHTSELPISSSHGGKTTETALPQPSVRGTSRNLSLVEQTNVVAFWNPHLEPGNAFQQNHDADSCFSDSVRPKDEPHDDESVVFETPLAMIHPEPSFSRNMGILYADYCSSDPVRTKDEPCDYDSIVPEIPIAMVHPQPLFSQNIASQDQASYYHSSKSSTLKQNINGITTNDGQRKTVKETLPVNAFKEGPKSQFLCVQEPSSLNDDITSTDLGEVNPTLDFLDKPIIQDVLGSLSDDPSNPQRSAAPIDSITMGISSASNQNDKESNQDGRNEHLKEPELSECANAKSHSLVVQQLQHNFDKSRPLHGINDISKGEERVRIPVVNETTSDKYPPSFNYIPRNIVYHQAYVKFSLAQIGDKDCCPDCFNDCITAPSPCACTRETGGKFAYTLDGLVRKEFLDECVSMYHDPQKHHMFYCQDCPVERVKNDVAHKACKGHLVRKFIKECWSKCGCSMHCGNRVVQRGITRNLQVFLTSREKGWGLRTLDKLPRGAFVCEYAGEVLTNMELYGRTMQTTGNAKHTYSVLLDVDWGTKGALKDEKALCLDATFYGNVARFINHRYSDAYLIEVPVEVETPDHYYYHLALFTIRKVEALEELTWDYGIDFNDHDYPVKAFNCRCGSRFSRDNKRRRWSTVL